ncbi:MAG TPA: hypothetical protein ACQGQG_05975 [Xylella sp.]
MASDLLGAFEGKGRTDFRSKALGRFEWPAHTALTIETVAMGGVSAVTVDEAEVGAGFGLTCPII